jgi:hypothetical protein
MTAPPRTPTDHVVLDRCIAEALGQLRTARAAIVHSRNSTSIRAEAEAESRLNALLECRYAARPR